MFDLNEARVSSDEMLDLNEVRFGNDEVSELRKLSDEQVHARAVRRSELSRKITLSLLRHLNEIERRHLYSKFSCSSLHAYCVKELKMDDGGAGRHVSAARLLREIPAIDSKIESGAMSVTSVSQAGVFFRKEAQCGKAFDLKAKQEVIMALENKSTREVDRILISNSSSPEIHFKEKIIPKSETTTEVRMHIDDDTLAAINRLKEIWSHAMPNASISDIVKRAALEVVEKHDPREKIKRAEKRKEKLRSAQLGQAAEFSTSDCGRKADDVCQTHMAAANEKSLPVQNASETSAGVSTQSTPAPECRAEIRRAVWKRDQSRCTFVDPRTGECCESKHFVEEDHSVPKALGGAYTIENIRLRCRAHNQRHAIDSFGYEKMQTHLRSMH